MNSLILLPLLAAAVFSAPHPQFFQPQTHPAGVFQYYVQQPQYQLHSLPIAFQIPSVPGAPGEQPSQNQTAPAFPMFPMFPAFPNPPQVPEQNNTMIPGAPQQPDTMNPPTLPPFPEFPQFPGQPGVSSTTQKPADGANQPANEEAQPGQSQGQQSTTPLPTLPPFPNLPAFPTFPPAPTSAPSAHNVVPQLFLQRSGVPHVGSVLHPSGGVSQQLFTTGFQKNVQPFVQQQPVFQYQYQNNPFVQYV